MPIYNKLVRDRIPEINKATEKKFTTRLLDNEENLFLCQFCHLTKKKSALELMAQVDYLAFVADPFVGTVYCMT